MTVLAHLKTAATGGGEHKSDAHNIRVVQRAHRLVPACWGNEATLVAPADIPVGKNRASGLESPQERNAPASWKCSGGDLNPHALRHTPLKRTCLPFHHPSVGRLNGEMVNGS